MEFYLRPHGGADGFVARCTFAEDAAALAAATGYNVYHKAYPTSVPLLVWEEGHEAHGAGDSYGSAAETMLERVSRNGDRRREP